MTVSNARPLLAASSPAAAVGALRARGLRVSAARRLVLEALYTAEGPVSAEAVAGGLDGALPASDLGSVYRNLDTLEEVGLVQHVHLGHGPGLWALADTGPREYLTCERCGDYRAVSPEDLEPVRALVRAAFGYEASWAHFPVVGLCAACAEASSPATAAREGAG
jgi:Fur family transcriptional regulator, ferric uptake regulator